LGGAESPSQSQPFLSTSAGGARKDTAKRLLNYPGRFGVPFVIEKGMQYLYWTIVSFAVLASRALLALFGLRFSFFMDTFTLATRAIDAFGHGFDGLHHFFEHWLLLEEDDLTGDILKGFFCEVQAVID
jgi:hypothetical protein